jgi:hypothetical protein
VNDPRNNLSNAGIGALGALLGTGRQEGARVWRDEELASLLAHQLRSPLSFDLTATGGAEPPFTIPPAHAEVTALPGSGVQTFADLLFGPSPSLPLLTLAKDFFKRLMSADGGPLPPNAAAALYYGSIVAARLRCGQSISAMPDVELERGLRHILHESWLDPKTRSLLTLGHEALSPTRS